MPGSVLVAGARTPIGKFLGALKSQTAADLGGAAIRGALESAALDPALVDLVIMGNVVQAGVGPNPAREAAVAGGVGLSTPALTLNDLCLSGLHAIILADQQISLGRAEVVVAGGMESMSNAPHLLMNSRGGFKYGSTGMADALEQDALICAFDGISMGASTERAQTELGIQRLPQDQFAVRSHELANAATESGALKQEIVAVEVPAGRGKTAVVETDEGIRAGLDLATLSALKPAFAADGTITAASSSPLSDGACAVIVMSKAKAVELGVAWIAEIGESGFVAGPGPSLMGQPAAAVKDALRRDGGLQVADLDLLEINEAFAGLVLQSVEELGIAPERVNVNGGAIAFGHPVGMSGARIALTAALELQRRGGGVAAAALCGGGGQGLSLILRVPAASV